jgi:hypothetical protein
VPERRRHVPSEQAIEARAIVCSSLAVIVTLAEMRRRQAATARYFAFFSGLVWGNSIRLTESTIIASSAAFNARLAS